MNKIIRGQSAGKTRNYEARYAMARTHTIANRILFGRFR